MVRCKPTLGIAAALLLTVSASRAQTSGQADTARVDTIKDVFARLYGCWKGPSGGTVNPMDITVIVSFNRAGEILGHPKITYESPRASDSDRLAYRVAVMQTLQRCTPMPFTETMAGAVAGHPFAIQFRHNKPQTEKRTWLSPRIL